MPHSDITPDTPDPALRPEVPAATRTRPATVALISLYDIENNASRLLAAGVRRAGHHAVEIFFKDWVNNRFVPPVPAELDALVSIVRAHGADLVAFCVRASAYHGVAATLTRCLREALGVPIMWGGTHAILDPEACLAEADLVCPGEGDLTIIDVLDCLAAQRPLIDVPNLWLRDGSTVRRNALRPLVQDLDSLPHRDYTHPDKYWIQGRSVRRGDPMVDEPVFQIMCSRGCVFTCSYCYNSTLATEIYRGQGRYYRFRSVESVLSEIKAARKVFRNMKRVRFDDEVFVFDPAWLDEFVERYPREIGLPFEAFIEPRLVEREPLTRLRAAGLSIIYMGVQNTQRVNKAIYDRNVPDDRVRAAVALFHELGLDYRIQVIVDDPSSTDEDKAYLFDLLLEFPRPFELYLFSLVVFPNTDLARKLIAAGLIAERDVEGQSTKTFQQMRVSLNWPRPPLDTFWCAMLVLVSKNFLPRPLLRWLSRSQLLRRHPAPLVWFAQACNVVKMATVCAGLLRRGELTATLIRRWANPLSLISQ